MSEADSGVSAGTKDRITAVVLLIFTGAMWYFTADIPPRSQLFPHMILSALGVLSALMLMRSFLGTSRHAATQRFFVNPRMLFLTLGAVIVYVIAVQWVGYFTASVVFIPGIALMLGQRGKKMVGVSTALFLLMIYLVFVVAFERPLPPEFWMN